MSTYQGMTREQKAELILKEAQRLCVREMIEPMVSKSGVIRGEDLPGCGEDIITVDELQARATNKADFELWWCRAAADKMELKVPFMDWYWYNSQLNSTSV